MNGFPHYYNFNVFYSSHISFHVYASVYVHTMNTLTETPVQNITIMQQPTSNTTTKNQSFVLYQHEQNKNRTYIIKSNQTQVHSSTQVYLCSRVGHTMGHIAYEATHVTVLDELRHTLSDVIKEAHGVSQEVHRAQDLGCLADQLLHK